MEKLNSTVLCHPPLSNTRQINQDETIPATHSNPYIHAATSDNTRRTYRAAIRRFEQWGGRLPTNKEVLVQYLTAQAEQLNPRTLSVHLTALSQWHLYQGLSDPTQVPVVRKTLEGIRRTHGQPKRKAKALRLEHLATMLSWLYEQPDTPKRARDIALILVGFFGAFRRSELVAMTRENLTWEPEGLLITLPVSKTDQQRDGLVRALPYGTSSVCPVNALKHWLDISATTAGPVFRRVNRWQQIHNQALYPGSVTDVLKSIGQACGFDFVPELSSHSFRRGLSTSASRENISFELIKKQGGWRSDVTVWGYIEEGRQLTHNATTDLMDKVAKMITTGSCK
ncbi:site-specific integrase [Zooshikella ganghwensis]|uniref:site-specific integrase n=1 Tax=Zooshikella ganghwensis TaxID=202772 RepID=UPI00041FA41E|nr:tyrosine-type recombinase/integrase [Zooshikella ganghwensis]